MPQQSSLTIVADVRPGETESLGEILATMGDGVANGSVVDLSSLSEMHFARFFLLEETTDLSGRPLPAALLYMSDFDVPKDRHLTELAGSPGIDRLFGHCEGYPTAGPTADQRLAYLRAHTVKEQARYVNTIGRGSRQIRREAELRDAIEGFLDRQLNEWAGRDPREIREAVRRFVAEEPSLAWARTPEDRPSLWWRLREGAHLVALPLLLLLLSPLLLLGAPFYAFLLRRHEKADPAPHLKPDEATVTGLARLEDHVVQNPFTAIGLVKPGLFRKLTIRGILYAIAYATRHVFNNGNLAGVKTIHFARWVILNEGRRVIFASNYDGSLESYMDDFIDKIAWGLNVVFSNGFGYPRTRWLVLDGARDELAFKDYLRRHQVPTRVWYSAYQRLTASNVANNERIRRGLYGDMGGEEARRWLQAL